MKNISELGLGQLFVEAVRAAMPDRLTEGKSEGFRKGFTKGFNRTFGGEEKSVLEPAEQQELLELDRQNRA